MERNRRISFNDPGHAHFLTFSCYRGVQIFTDVRLCMLFLSTLDEARPKHQFKIWSYVIMPEHVHLLLRPMGAEYSISRMLKAIKGPFAKRAVGYLKREHPERLARIQVPNSDTPIYRSWQRGGGYDRNLHSQDTIERAIDYIEWNPVRRGYVDTPQAWTWSSARARAGVTDVPLLIDAVGWNSK